ETQGLFIYRHDRLITWGGWHQMWDTNDEKTKLARVVVDFDSVLDDVLKLNVSKQLVQLPQQLQAEIKKIADVARKDSQKKYRKEAQQAPPAAPAPFGGGITTGGAPAGGGSNGSAPVVPTPPAPSGPAPNVTVKDVKTDKFVWKVTTGMTGALGVQVSDMNPSLSALVNHLRTDPHAIAHLAAFLGGLDEAGVQKHLMAKKDA
ncbi:MAG: hypothetical protein WCZ23_05350, partial [Rhodospirillaceae bacterium]